MIDTPTPAQQLIAAIIERERQTRPAPTGEVIIAIGDELPAMLERITSSGKHIVRAIAAGNAVVVLHVETPGRDVPFVHQLPPPML